MKEDIDEFAQPEPWSDAERAEFWMKKFGILQRMVHIAARDMVDYDGCEHGFSVVELWERWRVKALDMIAVEKAQSREEENPTPSGNPPKSVWYE